MRRRLLALVPVAAALVACANGANSAPGAPTGTPAAVATPAAPPPSTSAGLAGMPPVRDPHNVYADAGANMLADAVRSDKPLVYVPHSRSGDVWVIDPADFRVVARHPVGKELQHVVPSWDMRTLYATDDLGDIMQPIDPRSGTLGAKIPVVDPYNMYFTPDGRYAISVAERLARLVWYDPHSWQLMDETEIPECAGIDHADFTADGRIAVFTCEFAGRVVVVDVAAHRVLRVIDMPQRHTHMGPQDIKLAPDGSVFYIADSDANGLWVLDGAATAVQRFIPTGMGAHGLYLDREGKRLFVTNREEGSISVLDSLTGGEQTKWRLPGGGSPDMGGLTADGTQLWLSGRYHGVVYVISTANGELLRKIPVGNQPHGLCVWPQPGRYSLGHTGVTR